MHRHPLRQALRLPQAALKRLVTGLLRLVLLAYRPARLARSGFVLPTTVLLVLMVVLTATALTYRSFTRSDMAISQREQQVIANAATPALDRARAKIEFLFSKDSRLSTGLPTADYLASMMMANPYDPTVVALPNDPFTLPGEIRLDINRDGVADNAWSFVSDANGETIVYSILVDDEGPRNLTTVKIQNPDPAVKANALVTRTGPLATTEATSICSNARAERGWQVVNNGSTSTLQKNFQINVFVPNANNVNRTVEAFEFQQSRIANRGNKWAAWFRYDLEIYPGAPFTLNGAMHTDASLMATGGSANGSVTSYKISSHNSCVYGKEASEITVGAQSDDGSFEGQILNGAVMTNNYGTTNYPIFHIFDGDNQVPITNRQLTANNDSVSGGVPADVAVNPLRLFTEDKLVHTNKASWNRDNAWNNNPIFTGERIFNKRVAKPFVDDFSRADNRWGPKPRYSETDPTMAVSDAQPAGSPIAGAALLTDPVKGLDGYWERQAVKYGLRLIVGERLELGNPVEWSRNPATNTITQDRLYPPAGTPPTVGSLVGANEYRQKRALRDNLAAVQSMVVYHYKTHNGEFPAACMAMTAHPGTRETIARSRTFAQWISGRAKVDFLNGQGTDGWEFRYNVAFDTPGEFRTQVVATQPLGIALRNLAYFAGDPNGGAPYFPAVQDSFVHPFPHQAMWGDFSPLRRIIDGGGLDSAANFDALSPADKATVHSAACTLGMLATNLQDELDEFDALSSLSNFDNLTSVSGRVNNLVGAIAQYIRNNTDPGGNYTTSGVTLVQRLTLNNLHRERWMQNRIYNILRTQLAKRDPVSGEILTTADGKLILVNPVTNAELTDGTPIKDPDGNIIFDAEGVISGVAAAYDGNAATLTYLADRTNAYLLNNFLSGQTLKTSDALRATLAQANLDRPLGGFVENNGKNLGGASEYFNRVTFTQWKTLFPHGPGNIQPADVDKFEAYAMRVNRIYSLIRDRDLGFRAGKPQQSFTSAVTRPLGWDDQSGYVVPVSYGVGGASYTFELKTNCDPNVFRPILPSGGGGDNNVGISGLVGCSMQEELPIRAPSMYYLFPLVAHSHFGAGYHRQPGAPGYTGGQSAEEYITQTYISDRNPGTDRYKPVALTTETTPNDIIRGVRNIASVPASRTDLTTWVTPAVAATADTLLPTNVNDTNRAFSINICGQQQACFGTSGNLVAANLTGARVPFLDKGIFNGREQMAVRVLDIDLNRLLTSQTNSEFWIPDVACDPDAQDCDVFTEGIVYAFREDAVREDEIVRPKRNGQTADNCLTVAGITNACRMVTTPGGELDPPLTASGISLKPVDFVADPDRRPHGFRLRNGDDMSNNYTRKVGMTLVSDNSVYIQGNFNRHFATTGPIEEFTATVGDRNWTVANFYNDRTQANLNQNFAQPATDRWRPVEILADAVTLLSSSPSDTFIDGAAVDTFTVARPGTVGATASSYMNQSRPNAVQTVVRTARLPGEVGAPVFIDRNGNAYVGGNPINSATVLAHTATNWSSLSDDVDLRRRNTRAVQADMTVNAVFISGIVPSRPNQGYGGLHNYPRLNESWQAGTTLRSLNIAGSFLQLNFATASTGPFEHDAWEPNDTPVAGAGDGERLGYYNAPTRRWGYDPGLLYYPPAAAARRFVSVDTPRSEYFRELPADDPYIVNLRCARNGTTPIFDASIRGTCPA
jgi:hypothetical protein